MDRFIGMQVGAVSFTDEGVGTVLDSLEQRAGVNALLLSAASWLRGTAGRSATFFPDHGSQEPDDFEGGLYFKPDPQYYRQSPVQPSPAPEAEVQGFDILADVIPDAKARGMKVYPYYCERYRTAPHPISQPGFQHVLELDEVGRKASRPCFRNPGYKAFMLGMVEDWCRSHDIDGVVWGIERRGPIGSVLDGDQATCFCNFCRAAGDEVGISATRARAGYARLAEYVRDSRSGKRQRDGQFVEFLRILFKFPEILAWESLWTAGHKAFHREVYGLVKWLDPDLEVGMHVWQFINTYDLFLKAQYDLSELRECADWVKPVVYQTPAGSRFKRYVDRATETIWGDFDGPELTTFLYRILQLNEAPYEELPEQGFSSDYVKTETARTVEALDGVPVYAGVNVGVEGYPDERQLSPDDVKAAIHSASTGGAEGVVLCRNYTETYLRNLEAAGDALKEIGWWTKTS